MVMIRPPEAASNMKNSQRPLKCLIAAMIWINRDVIGQFIKVLYVKNK